MKKLVTIFAIATPPMVAFLPSWVAIAALTIFVMITFWQVTK